MHNSRPRLNIPLSPADKLMEALGWLTLCVLWVLTIMSYAELPDSIPVHFDAAGKPDRVGSKTTLFLTTGIATVLYVGLSLLNRHPHIFNYPTEITEENAQRMYTVASRMLRYVKLAVIVIFTFILYRTIHVAHGDHEGMGVWFLPAILGVIFIPLIFFLVQFFRKS